MTLLLNRRSLATLALAAALPLAASAAFPDKQIRLVVPYSAGGGTDTIARLDNEGSGKLDNLIQGLTRVRGRDNEAIVPCPIANDQLVDPIFHRCAALADDGNKANLTSQAVFDEARQMRAIG